MLSPRAFRTFGPLLVLCGAALFAPARAFALTYTLDLTDSSLIDRTATTGLWDTVNGKIEAAQAANSTVIDFGDGSDGAFTDGPAQTGITVAGTAITIDTDTKATYQFTSFTLDTGYTIQVTGSLPLVIKVYGMTTVNGTISADGGNGTDNGTAGPGNQRVGLIAGGTGVAGGANGGNGGQTDGTVATNGGAGYTGTSAGPKGATAGSGVDIGGSAGCNGTTGGSVAGGNNGGNVPVCAAQATIAAGFDATAFTGGAGGGGGGEDTGPPIVGGGAGGAGGGAIRFASVGPIVVGGVLSAKGGAGGGDIADGGGGGDCGGGGGGGAGGSIWLQSLGATSGAGSVVLSGGAGGDSVVCSGFGYQGGTGTAGTFRADGTNTLGAPDATNTIAAAATGTYTVLSKPLDFSKGIYAFNSAAETLGCGGTTSDIAITYEGSTDGVTFGTGVTQANLSQLSGSAYVRVRAQITGAGAATPCLTGLTIDYDLKTLTTLNLRGGLIFCGSQAGGSNRLPVDPKGAAGDGALLLLSALAACKGRKLFSKFRLT